MAVESDRAKQSRARTKQRAGGGERVRGEVWRRMNASKLKYNSIWGAAPKGGFLSQGSPNRPQPGLLHSSSRRFLRIAIRDANKRKAGGSLRTTDVPCTRYMGARAQRRSQSQRDSQRQPETSRDLSAMAASVPLSVPGMDSSTAKAPCAKSVARLREVIMPTDVGSALLGAPFLCTSRSS